MGRMEAASAPAWAGINRIALETADSTNVRAAILAKEGAAEGTLVIAGEQTAGKGRRGRSWHSPPGSGIYMSLILKPAFAPDKASMVTLVMALAVSRAIDRLYGLTTEIKWPNDILLRGKKVCGILTELHLEERRIGSLIIGVGVNVKKQGFPEEVRDIATSLEEADSQQGFLRGPGSGDGLPLFLAETKKQESPCGEEQLIDTVMICFEEIYAAFLQTGDLSLVREEYHAKLLGKGRRVSVSGAKELQGEALGINSQGELLIRLDDGRTEEVCAGEVSVRGIYGYV